MGNYGSLFRKEISDNAIVPLIGIYDAFSATLVKNYFNSIFCSGYGFSASRYGLPDEGFIAWQDMVSYVENLRSILPEMNIIVDIDDGYGDDKIAREVVHRLENVGASAVILEDQRRPKKCGHLPGKDIIERADYLRRLDAVLNTRNDLFVIARTDSTEIEEAISRVNDFHNAGADAILVEGLGSYESVKYVRNNIPKEALLVVNLIAGGKMGPVSLDKLEECGVNLVVYSTPCLFAAHEAIKDTMENLKESNGILPSKESNISLAESNQVLTENLKKY